MERRQFLSALLLTGTSPAIIANQVSVDEAPEWGANGAIERDEWLGSVIGEKSFGASSQLSKFQDGMYYLQAPLPWAPNKSDSSVRPITVEKGFVTDLASIPRPFWSLLPRDGEYADAAIVHDYLYWRQQVSRQDADDIFRLAMRDLEVHPAVISIIYRGVRSWFGEHAWENNAALRRAGESRQLLRFPPTSATRWSVWKNQTGNLARGG